MITGSNSIITSKNSNSITKSLISLAGNASIASLLQNATANTGNANANLSNMIASGSETMAAVNTKIENATKIANSITTVLKLMK